MYACADGVFLVVQGLPTPNKSLVDVDDILDVERFVNPPSPSTYNEALLCETDLVRCCQTPRLGSWYFPNGSIVPEDQEDVYIQYTYRSSWGQNENGRQGSVRLYRRYTNSTGRFHCKLPDANNDTQTLHAILGENNSI